MAKYRKKPTAVVEAEVATYDHHIETLEGRMFCREGDYVVTGSVGERYPVKKEIFEETYESAETCFVDICCDFDGFLSSYKSGWVDAHIIPDPPVEGAIEALHHWLDEGLSIAIYSARSSQPHGVDAMMDWVSKYDQEYRTRLVQEIETAGTGDPKTVLEDIPFLVDAIEFPFYKPAAQLYPDDRGFRFMGPPFPTAEELRSMFNVWYRSD